MKTLKNLIVFIALLIGSVSCDGQMVPSIGQVILPRAVNEGIVEGTYITLAPATAQLQISSNAGVTFLGAGSTLTWRGCVMSENGQYQVAVNYDSSNGRIYYSSDFGATWAQSNAPVKLYYTVAASADLSYIIVGAKGGYLYRSLDKGQTWATASSVYSYYDYVTVNETGQYQAACDRDAIYVSSNYGASFTKKSTVSRSYIAIAVSGTGQYQVCAVQNGQLYFSTDYGNSWNVLPNSITANWISIAISNNGQYILGGLTSGITYRSSDFGASFSIAFNNTQTWWSSKISKSGKNQYLGATYLYRSTDYGVTWSQVSYFTGTSIRGIAIGN